MQNIIGIDIGGSHITLAQVQPEKHELINATYLRERVDSFAAREIILPAWVYNINRVIEGLQKEELLIGVAMPAPFDYENGVSLMLQGKFRSLYEVNVKQELIQSLGIESKQIHFINDATAFLEGEIYASGIHGYRRIFGITLGTGLGTAFYNGSVATDEDLWDSPFRESICEDYLATRWFVNRYNTLTGDTISGVIDLWDKSEEIRHQMFNEYAVSLAEFILKYVKYYDPEILLIGGNIAKSFPFFSEQLQDILQENRMDLNIQISEVFENAAILGAASHALKMRNKI
ncbi:ROK family protein [Elizabethkingia argentiflava]|uniref:ROK family protein n=1 Tax=Elizabethkingia argenteiflava TaxID=2681556 RepID=A0A845PVW4_9FLAO|nr:ROK family protein [Elizabethkingia argenteiflava]NAW51964.1 ROK family protein [Elizabethkingia argenteiflava]